MLNVSLDLVPLLDAIVDLIATGSANAETASLTAGE